MMENLIEFAKGVLRRSNDTIFGPGVSHRHREDKIKP